MSSFSLHFTTYVFFLCTILHYNFVKFRLFFNFFYVPSSNVMSSFTFHVIFYIFFMPNDFLHVPSPYFMSIFIQLFLFCYVTHPNFYVCHIFSSYNLCLLLFYTVVSSFQLCQVVNFSPLFCQVVSTLSSCQLFPFLLSSLTTFLSSCVNFVKFVNFLNIFSYVLSSLSTFPLCFVKFANFCQVVNFPNLFPYVLSSLATLSSCQLS